MRPPALPMQRRQCIGERGSSSRQSRAASSNRFRADHTGCRSREAELMPEKFTTDSGTFVGGDTATPTQLDGLTMQVKSIVPTTTALAGPEPPP